MMAWFKRILPGALNRLSGLALLALASQALAAPEQPNVVVILADDMGWNDVGYHGSEIRTPRLDSLAEQGVRLNRFYAQPTCSPTRSALMTGKSSLSLGIVGPLSKLVPTGLPLSEKLMPEYFQAAGYQTLMAGKWHLGFRSPEYRPQARGFEHFYGHLTGGIGYWDHVHGGGLDWQRNGEGLREEGYSTHLLADEIDRLIEGRDPQRPMFLYASFNAPHLPGEAPEKAVEQYSEITDVNRRIHAAMVTELDSAIGRLVDTLEEQGMLDNTLIWFMSDNGGLNPSAYPAGVQRFATAMDDFFGESQVPLRALEFARRNILEGGADNTPFRRGKQSVYEGGVRVPALLYWKGQLKPHTLDAMLTVQDVLPTLLAATNVANVGAEFHGADQWPAIRREAQAQTPDYVIKSIEGEALYRFPWKLIALASGDAELYQLADDPEERHNLATVQPERVAQLTQALAAQPRGEAVNLPVYRVVWDVDFFGGEEDRQPWSEINP